MQNYTLCVDLVIGIYRFYKRFVIPLEPLKFKGGATKDEASEVLKGLACGGPISCFKLLELLYILWGSGRSCQGKGLEIREICEEAGAVIQCVSPG